MFIGGKAKSVTAPRAVTNSSFGVPTIRERNPPGSGTDAVKWPQQVLSVAILEKLMEQEREGSWLRTTRFVWPSLLKQPFTVARNSLKLWRAWTRLGLTRRERICACAGSGDAMRVSNCPSPGGTGRCRRARQATSRSRERAM
jgi:hypothetical protein